MSHPVFNPSARQQATFVDREAILGRFDDMRHGRAAQQVLWVHGRTGTGKTMLVHQMAERCDGEATSHRPLILEWRDTRRLGYLEAMRMIRDQIDTPALFTLFNEKANQLTQREYTAKIEFDVGDIRDVKVLPDGTIENSDLSIHVGHEVEVKDLHLNLVVDDDEANEGRVRRELSAAFLPCLAAAARQCPCVILLDGVEKADPATRSWVLEELVERLWTGDLPQTLVVITSWDEPPEDIANRMFDLVDVLPLEGFAADHVLEYLKRRVPDVPEDVAGALVTMVLGNSQGGLPIEVAKVVNNFIRQARGAS
jgi:hypothetical protein